MSGCKGLYRCEQCLRSWIVPRGYLPAVKCDCGGPFIPLLRPILRDFNLVTKLQSPAKICAALMERLNHFNNIQV